MAHQQPLGAWANPLANTGLAAAAAASSTGTPTPPGSTLTTPALGSSEVFYVSASDPNPVSVAAGDKPEARVAAECAKAGIPSTATQAIPDRSTFIVAKDPTNPAVIAMSRYEAILNRLDTIEANALAAQRSNASNLLSAQRSNASNLLSAQRSNASNLLSKQSLVTVPAVIAASQAFGGGVATTAEHFAHFRGLFVDDSREGTQWAQSYYHGPLQALFTAPHLTVADNAIIGQRNNDAHLESSIPVLLREILDLDDAHSTLFPDLNTADTPIPRQALAVIVLTLIRLNGGNTNRVLQVLRGIHTSTAGVRPTPSQWTFLGEFGLFFS